ncbi:extracellular nuclease [Nitzschia inconspicua]|uniref:Extracellular nuclease n=1 Tax=Nitzschia inconspicua TaxID=303405 RepID=A0A9K3L4A7_9STRA|nr:extracellular nuclease [Nitzschia inconspicua]
MSKLGDKVVVTGIVQENFGNTVIEAQSVEIVSSGEDLPSYSEIELPMNLEAVEAMLVKFKQDLIITEQFNLDRFSEVGLYAGTERPYQFTQINDPSMSDIQAYLDELKSMSIIYEDGRDGSTNDVDYFDGFSPYSTATAPRMGDIIETLQGVLGYSFGAFRVRSIIDGSVSVTKKNERPEFPPNIGDGLRIATVLIDLVTALNTRLGGPVYSFVDPGREKVDVSDAISVGFIYKPSAYSVIGSPSILDDTVAATLGFSTAIFDGVDTNRAALAVTFESVIGEKCITIVNNHFKSKGASGSSGENADQGDGQGAWNVRRSLAAQAVIEWLKTNPTSAVCDREMIMGDLNAYAREDAVRVLLEAGYKNVKDEMDYSYVFDGQIGTLDYILVNENMDKDVENAGVWHVNEDEADALDYTLRFGRPATFFDGTVPWRSSDHSPVLVGLKKEKDEKKPRKKSVTFESVAERAAISITFYQMLEVSFTSASHRISPSERKDKLSRKQI